MGFALNDLLYWRLFLFQVELYINGAKSPQKNKKPIERPEDHAGLVLTFFSQIVLLWILNCLRKPLVIRLGHNYYDKTPLIGKIVDINIWDRCWSMIIFFKCGFDLDYIIIMINFCGVSTSTAIKVNNFSNRNLWNFLRLLSPEEGIEYTNCLSYVPTPPGD